MTWWLWLFCFITAAGVAAIIVRKEEKSDPSGKNAAAPVRKAGAFECAYCDKRAPKLTLSEHAAYSLGLEELGSLVSEQMYRVALTRMEKLLTQAPHKDHILLVSYISECFEGLCFEKNPQEVIEIFDKLRREGSALAFAVSHGQSVEMAKVLAHSLTWYPEVKSTGDLKQAVDFLRQDHPLIKFLREGAPNVVSDFLDRPASRIVEGWEPGQHRDNIPLLMEKLRAQL